MKLRPTTEKISCSQSSNTLRARRQPYISSKTRNDLWSFKNANSRIQRAAIDLETGCNAITSRRQLAWLPSRFVGLAYPFLGDFRPRSKKIELVRVKNFVAQQD